MKKYPQNPDQWAHESFQALLPAWDQLLHEHPYPTEKQKEKLIEFATEIACANRDIDDPTFISHAHVYVKSIFKENYKNRDTEFKANFSQYFLSAYFDAHLSLSMITQEVVDDAIKLLDKDFDLNYEGNPQSNVFSIKYPDKS